MTGKKNPNQVLKERVPESISIELFRYAVTMMDDDDDEMHWTFTLWTNYA